MRATREEHHARELQRIIAGKLVGTGATVKADGGGVQCHVDLVAGTRRARIHCFDYGAVAGALVLGLRGNAHLSKVRVGAEPVARVGAEYLTYFLEEAGKVATARSQDVNDTVAAVLHWVVDGVSRDRLYELHGFVDERRRSRHSVADQVNHALAASGAQHSVEHHEEESESGELWIYAGQRSVRLEPSKGEISIALLMSRTQLARQEQLDVSTAAVLSFSWAEQAACLESLRKVHPTLELSPFALEFERGEYSAWHWGSVLLQSEHDEVLALYRPLIKLVARHDKLRQLFSFTSLNRLCFSRCSLYPFVTGGLPLLAPAGKGAVAVAFGERPERIGTADEIFSFLVETLSDKVQPTWFGNCDEHLAARLNRELEGRGSDLRARARQVAQWLRVEVAASDGRSCHVSSVEGDSVFACMDLSGARDGRKTKGSVSEVIDAITSWLSQREG